MKKMIFYHPIEIEYGETLNKQSGSYIRPMQMLEGFNSLGYQVIYITGSIKSRTKQVRALLRENKDPGVEFCYVESANIPLALSNAKHWPVNCLGDRNNLRNISRYMKIGIFYRDIYWKYEDYLGIVGRVKGTILKMLFFHDFVFYRRIFDYIFVPSNYFIKMCPNVKGRAEYMVLPPGCKEGESLFNDSLTNGLSLYYSGNIAYGTEYSITEIVDYSVDSEFVNTLTINTSIRDYKESYSQYKQNLPNFSSKKIEFTFLPYEKNQSTTRRYDIALMRLSKSGGFEFAMPIKIYDYIGMGLPIIAYNNTAVGNLIEQYNLGWTITSKDDFLNLVKRLNNNRSEIIQKHKSVLQFKSNNTWQRRCEDVAKVLSK